jgi:hypothetical protein
MRALPDWCSLPLAGKSKVGSDLEGAATGGNAGNTGRARRTFVLTLL